MNRDLMNGPRYTQGKEPRQNLCIKIDVSQNWLSASAPLVEKNNIICVVLYCFDLIQVGKMWCNIDRPHPMHQACWHHGDVSYVLGPAVGSWTSWCGSTYISVRAVLAVGVIQALCFYHHHVTQPAQLTLRAWLANETCTCNRAFTRSMVTKDISFF